MGKGFRVRLLLLQYLGYRASLPGGPLKGAGWARLLPTSAMQFNSMTVEKTFCYSSFLVQTFACRNMWGVWNLCLEYRKWQIRGMECHILWHVWGKQDLEHRVFLLIHFFPSTMLFWHSFSHWQGSTTLRSSRPKENPHCLPKSTSLLDICLPVVVIKDGTIKMIKRIWLIWYYVIEEMSSSLQQLRNDDYSHHLMISHYLGRSIGCR